MGLPCHILRSNADKLGRGAAARKLAQMRRALADEGFAASVQLFSAMAGQGVDEARVTLATWPARAEDVESRLNGSSLVR